MLGDLSTNFYSYEFRCPCPKCKDKEVRVNSLLLFKLEMLRAELGNEPVYINSGNRCPEYNRIINGFSDSTHIPNPDGEAADIKMMEFDPIDIGLAAERVGGMRIGIGDTFVHLDVRPPSPSKFWIYEIDIIYSGSIENKSLLKFYQIIKEGR